MIDYRRLRRKLIDECMAAHFAGFEPALMEAWEIESAPDEALETIALRLGVNPYDYDWLPDDEDDDDDEDWCTDNDDDDDGWP